tara:strand:+ start:641 stop:1036 length:396 start_codon:yes stop_codon:yes gene_type:complete
MTKFAQVKNEKTGAIEKWTKSTVIDYVNLRRLGTTFDETNWRHGWNLLVGKEFTMIDSSELVDLSDDPTHLIGYKPQDNRICLFYVTQRLEDILGPDGETYGMETALQDFHRECTYNLGVNALRNHLGDEE